MNSVTVKISQIEMVRLSSDGIKECIRRRFEHDGVSIDKYGIPSSGTITSILDIDTRDLIIRWDPPAPKRSLTEELPIGIAIEDVKAGDMVKISIAGGGIEKIREPDSHGSSFKSFGSLLPEKVIGSEERIPDITEESLKFKGIADKEKETKETKTKDKKKTIFGKNVSLKKFRELAEERR